MKRKSKSLFATLALLVLCHKVVFAQTTLTYSFTGGPQSFTVPPCVSQLSLTAKGAMGGSNPQGVLGGQGGLAFGVLGVNPGDVLTIFVGGSNGYNGGGPAGTSPCTAAIGGAGGGASDVRLNGSSLADRVIAGGGGGGAGGSRIFNCGRGTGGGGGGGYFGGGGGAGSPSTGGYVLPTGGSQSAGGIAGTSGFCSCNNGNPGQLGTGGGGGTEVSTLQGGNNTAATGGAGGGLLGGSGQYTPNACIGEGPCNIGCGSSGAGGSSYTGTLLNAYTTSGFNSGDGEVIISYTTGVFAMPLNLTQASICMGGSVTLIASGQATYSWSTGSNASSVVVSPSTNTTYSVSGTSSLGCLSTGSLAVMVDVSPPTVSINSSTNSICQGNTVTLSGAGANSYTWSAGVVNGSPFIPGATSSYSVTGSNGCGTATAAVSVSVNPNPTVLVSPASVTLCAGNTSTFTATGASTYQWTGGILNGASFVPSSTNVYTVTGYNSYGCAGTATSAVNVLPAPSLSTVPSSTFLCSGETATIFATGSPNYTWLPGGSNAYSLAVSPGSTSVYTVSGAIGNCVDTKTITMVVAATPTVSAVVSNTSICSGMPVTFSASGASSYSWTGGVQNGVPYFPSFTSSYTVTGQNLSGCSASAAIAVSVTSTPSIPPVSSQSSVCPGGSITLSASGASGYTWMPGNATTATIVVLPITAATYTLLRQNGPCADSQTISIGVIAPPVIQVSGPNAICAGEAATLTASGAQNYTWAPNGSNSPTISVSPSQATSFSVSGFNGACTATAVASLVVNPIPNISISPSVQSICSGQSLTLTAMGANSYTWTSSSSPSGINAASIVVSPTINTVYTLTGTNAFQCTSLSSRSIQVTAGPVLSAQANPNLLCPAASLFLSASGASGYTWSAPGNITFTGPSFSLAPTSTAVYTVLGSVPGNSCTGTATVQARVFIPNISISAPNMICAGESATLSASGATSYTWNPSTNPFPFQNMVVSPLQSTVYYLATTSSSSGVTCISNNSLSLQVNPLPSISISASNKPVCVKDTVSLVASGAATYTWSSGANTATLNLTQTQVSQSYSVSGSSTAGCVSNATITINLLKCVGIEEQVKGEVRIYPNPSDGTIYIHSPTREHFSLINGLGQIIDHFTVDNNAEHKIEGLANGIYFVVGANHNQVFRLLVFSNP